MSLQPYYIVQNLHPKVAKTRKRETRVDDIHDQELSMKSSLIFFLIQSTIVHQASAYGIPPPLCLRKLLEAEIDGTRTSATPIVLPCCYDGLSARLVARAGFDATFMTGFGVSGVNGYPDAQLISYGEMVHAATVVAEGLSSAALEMNCDPIPCIADGDTGYGNAMNAKRTLFGIRMSINKRTIDNISTPPKPNSTHNSHQPSLPVPITEQREGTN